MADTPTTTRAKVVSLNDARRVRRLRASTAPGDGAPPRPRGLLYTVAAAVLGLGATASCALAAYDVWATRGGDEGALRVLARSGPLTAAALAHLWVFAPASLLVTTLVMGGVHVCDFWIGVAARDAVKVALPLGLAVATLASAIPQVAEAAMAKRKP